MTIDPEAVTVGGAALAVLVPLLVWHGKKVQMMAENVAAMRADLKHVMGNGDRLEGRIDDLADRVHRLEVAG